jgi:hypothetical protein
MQWLQDPSPIYANNLNNKRRAASRHFRNKKKENLKSELKELGVNNKTKSIRDLYRGHQ